MRLSLRSYRPVSILLLGALLTGCTADKATSLVERYVSRTGNAIEVDIDLSLSGPATLYPALPERRERLASVPEIREGLLDLFDMRHCDLMRLVSERNTSLSRVALPSQRLKYELQIMPALRECESGLADIAELEDLRTKLQGFLEVKQQGFAPLVFNAIYTSSEIEQQFSFGAAPLEPAELSYLGPIVEPMERFKLIAELTNRDDWEPPSFALELEADYEALYRSDFGARWLSSMAMLTQVLEQTSQALESRMTGRPICFNGKQNNQSDILWTVFMKFYVGELQPYIAQVEREGRRWQQLNQDILSALAGVSQTALLTPYFESGTESPVWGRYLSARERHTRAWQQLLEQCGLRPGLPAS